LAFAPSAADSHGFDLYGRAASLADSNVKKVNYVTIPAFLQGRAGRGKLAQGQTAKVIFTQTF
jgi:hypothetical protein